MLRLNYNFQTSATNELPLTAINFHRASTPNTPDSVLHEPHDYLFNFSLLRVSPLATNERPLSCSCLPALITCHDSTEQYRHAIPSILIDVASSVFPTTSSWMPTGMAKTIKNGPKRLTKIYKIEKMRRNSWSAEYLMMTHNDLTERSLRVASAEAPVICLTQSHDHLFDELIYMRTSTCGAHALSPSSSLSPLNRASSTNFLLDPPPLSLKSVPTNHPATAQSGSLLSQSTQTTTTKTTTINPSSQPNPITITPPTIVTTTDHPHHHHPTMASGSANVGVSAITSQSPGGTSSTATTSSSSSSVRRQRHSIAGQMSYFKMLGFGGFSKKMATSTNSLFSTAVISGSSSAPNLRDMIPNTASPSGKCDLHYTLLVSTFGPKKYWVWPKTNR